MSSIFHNWLYQLYSLIILIPYEQKDEADHQGRTQDFKPGGPEISKIFFFKIRVTHPYSINKLSTKTNTQKSLFLNILRYNLLTKTFLNFTFFFFLFFCFLPCHLSLPNSNSTPLFPIPYYYVQLPVNKSSDCHYSLQSLLSLSIILFLLSI